MGAPRTSSRLPIVLIVAAILAVIAVPLVLVGPERPRPAEEQPEGVRAVPGEIRTIPQLDTARKQQLIRGLQVALETLYGRAFFGEPVETEANGSPTATPATPVDDLFTDRARAALRAHPGIFQPMSDVRTTSGRVSFAGIVTLESDRPEQALFDVRFEADGTPRGPAVSEVRIRQRGTILLVFRADRWQVAGFNLKFASRPQTPSPSP